MTKKTWSFAKRKAGLDEALAGRCFAITEAELVATYRRPTRVAARSALSGWPEVFEK